MVIGNMEIANHLAHRPTGIVLERIKHLPVGGKMADIPVELQHKSFVRKGDKKTGGPNLRLLRLERENPSLTVTAYIFNKFVHPIEDRYITPREAACLQDFPDNYEFHGSITHVQSQIGNAVPVRLGAAIARSVASFLKDIGDIGSVPVVSFFSGAGGLDLGFEMAEDHELKFHTIFSTDIDAGCIQTIRNNRPDWNAVQGNIMDLTSAEILRWVEKGEGVVIGGPPCQSFSVAGKQRGTNDPLGLLYRNFVQHVSVISPKIVVMENVFGLTQVKSGNVLGEIHDAFNKIGYRVSHKELFSQKYGTPQKRRRLIFVAVPARNSHVKFEFPEPTHAASDNLFNLPKYRGAGNSMEHLPSPSFRG